MDSLSFWVFDSLLVEFLLTVEASSVVLGSAGTSLAARSSDVGGKILLD